MTMLQILRPFTPPNPSAEAMNPPTNAPAMPSTMVIIKPPGSSRGIKIAVNETADLSLYAQMYKESAQYVASKRTAVEVSGEVGEN